jgi:hypothetical protein
MIVVVRPYYVCVAHSTCPHLRARVVAALRHRTEIKTCKIRRRTDLELELQHPCVRACVRACVFVPVVCSACARQLW